MQSVEELEQNLSTYREQLEQVNQLLDLEPGNDEYREMAGGLVEVIELTQELLASAQQQKQQQQDLQDISVPQAASAPRDAPGASTIAGRSDESSHVDVAPAAPASVAASDTPAAPFRLTAGAPVQAVWTGANDWREGVIDRVTRGGYVVRFAEEVGNGAQLQEVREAKVRLRGEEEGEIRQRAQEALAAVEREAEATRQALKRKMAEAAQKDVAPTQIPLKLRIQPDDSEDVKAEKKRKIHAIKSRQRMQNLEIMQSKRQNAWQQFQSKGRQKKAGFFTGKKKESMFKSPEEPQGRVGVVGSGQSMTEFQRRGKHANLKTGEDDDEGPD